MNLTHLQLTGVLTHANTQLDVPARGVVLVLGANGSGKSALVESVALAAWGKSLRGTPVWAGENGSVTVTTDTLRIERMRKNNRAALQWSLLGASAPTYDTASKAQAALDNAIIPFDVWRRTHVFSSSDAAHFALASDAERKRLLESVLGLAKFDAARERARVELRAAERTLAETEGYLKACHAELSRVAERGKDAEARRDAAVVPQAEVDAARAAVCAAEALVEEGEENAAACRGEIDARSRLAAMHEAAAKEHRAAAHRVSSSQCGTCGQAFPDADARAAQFAEATAAAATWRRHAEEAHNALGPWRALYAAVNEDLQAARQKLRAAQAAEQEVLARRAAAVEIEATLAREEEALAAAADACHGAEQARDAALDAAEESRAVERVFSMTGVRAQLLSGALQGIESIADAWLARLAPQARPMHLRLKSYTEKASGAVSDAISLDVEGAGGGHGYRGASGGERQRINVALCLALGEVASAAYGIAPGTLFLDEVFDALDADGVAAVRDALEDMARDRAVLVITHAPALVESLAAAEVWHVDRGVVTVTRSAP